MGVIRDALRRKGVRRHLSSKEGNDQISFREQKEISILFNSYKKQYLNEDYLFEPDR